MPQLTLDDAVMAADKLESLRRRPMPENLTLAERFQIFHQQNPDVYASLCDFAREVVREAKQRGKRPYCPIAMIYERARYEMIVKRGLNDYALNNSYRAFYARMIDANEPDLKGLFKMRRQRCG